MGYFTFIASQSFKTDAEGRRLFCPYGVLARPYIVDDAALEARLFRKMTLFMAVSLVVVFLAALAVALPMALEITRTHGHSFPFMPFVGFVAIVGILQWIAVEFVFGPDLRKLPRATSRVTLRMTYLQFGRQLPVPILIVGLVACSFLVLCGIVAMFCLPRQMTVPAAGMILIGSLCAAAYGYALRLKGGGA